MAEAASAPAEKASAPDVVPNQTLYLNNLNEKIKRADLKRALYGLFSQFGRIIQIVAKGTFRLKGQAWVVFDDITAATSAKRQLQGFPVFEKPLVSCASRGRGIPPAGSCLSGCRRWTSPRRRAP